MERDAVKKICDNDSYLRSKLYCRGYLITDTEPDEKGYPFYGAWNKNKIGRFNIFNHNLLPCHIEKSESVTIGLLGHAFDPVAEEPDEEKILKKLLGLFGDKDLFFEAVNDLTGVYCLFAVQKNKLYILNDTVALMPVFYTTGGNSPFYASSHVNLISDFAGFTEDKYITRLKSCRTFYYFGNQLPGVSSKFAEVERMTPNHYLTVDNGIKLTRFYYPHSLDLSDDEIVNKLCDILTKTMKTIAAKWKRPGISLTGGCDSKTTLAASSGIYDKFIYFSYDSQPNEKPDADAAAEICKKLKLPHKMYKVPYDDGAFEKIDGIKKILIWNGGDIRDNNPNDIRKRAYLDKISDYDVDIKSWASEVCRARYSKRYAGKMSFGKKPSPRKCTTFYKFLLNRKIINDTDKVFKYYLDNYFQSDKNRPIPWQDQLYWEWHWPSRDGVTMVSEHMFSDIITVPYNNRRIMELLLSTSYENRYNDVIYTRVRERLDSRIDAAAKGVVDVNHTKTRAVKELLYYKFNTMLPY